MGRLHYAVRRGLLAEVEAAIADGEPVDATLDGGLTALHIACQEGYTKLVHLLLDAGASPLLQHSNGRTALHFAAGGGHLNAVVALVERGVPVDIPTKGGRTPALEAALFNRREVVRYLLDQGADPKVTGRKDKRSVAEWLEVGGIQSQFPLSADRRSVSDPHTLEYVRKMMEQAPTVEAYAARHGRNFLIYSLDQKEFPDPDADRWAKRLGEILRSPSLLAECEDRYLDGEERAAAQKRRERSAHAEARRRIRDEERARRRRNLT